MVYVLYCSVQSNTHRPRVCECCLVTVVHVVITEGGDRASRSGNNVPERVRSGKGELCYRELIFINIP